MAELAARPPFTPYYEMFGEQRVRSGTYTSVIRADHMHKICGELLSLLDQ
jgi:hypothetical protein